MRRAWPFLLLGLLLSVMVAWSIVLVPSKVRTRVESSAGAWPVVVPEHWPAPSKAYCERWNRKTRWIYTAIDPNGTVYMIEVVELGWPLRIVHCEDWLELTNRNGQLHLLTQGHPTSIWRRGIGVQFLQQAGLRVHCSAIPIRPALPSFIASWLLFAGFGWLIVSSVRATRASLRRFRGCCPFCGYNVRGDFEAGCPECGWCRPRASHSAA